MSSDYTRLPTNEDEAPVARQPSYADDPRFIQPKVAAWKRGALIGFILGLLFLGYSMRTWGSRKPLEDEIVHAER